MPFNLPFKKGN
ncbi:uncharacterized protein FFM5_07290 [Fusarium fujikuroi]|nr:uncharacterized protein FFM5_07290 [Fusarium fujikuroi]